MIFQFSLICKDFIQLVLLISPFIMRIRPLGIGLFFHFYFDSSYLLGSTAAIEKYTFFVTVCAAFTHECPTLRAGLRNDKAAIGPSALLLGRREDAMRLSPSILY